MSTTAKIGAFFLVVLVAAAVLILRIEEIPIGGKARRHVVEVHFADVAGLDDKSAARVAGVRVGKVDGIRLLPDGTALVRIALNPDVELRQGATGQVRSLSLLGEKFVELFPGPPGGPVLADGARIEGTSVTSLDDLTKLAGDIGKDVKELTGSLRGSLGGPAGEEKLNRIIDNLGRLAESLAQMVDANRRNIDATLANLREFSSGMNQTLARLDRILEENRASFHGTIANADELSAKLKSTAENLDSITRKIDEGKGTIGQLVNSPETGQNLNSTLKSVKEGVDQLNAALTETKKIELELGFRGEYGTRFGTGQGYFTLDIMPNGKRFYRLELVSPSGGRRYDQTDVVTVTPPGQPPETWTFVSTRYEDKLAFSAQMGYRWSDTILRAGLIESRGGVGLDQFLWKDRLRLTAEFWDFNRPDLRPELKAYGRWVPRKNFFIVGGVEDILNPQTRSPFIGAGFSWTDERIKSLLGTVTVFK
jgi:phospholipid/cholesterol/gamma-HCH transport system substrate-binding protein